MIRFAMMLFCLLPLAAKANPVVVKSGEHDGFTRLVMDFGAPVDWSVGRSLDGYTLHLAGSSAIYDLTEAFALIGKGRLAALWADPNTGDLQVGIACACHAMPFEFRPGIVVVDLKDGPPPKGSSFELTLGGSKAPPIADRKTNVPRPKPRPEISVAGYDWLKPATAQPESSPVDNAATESLADPALEPLRESLLWQMSKGAAEGVVDMTSPPNREPDPEVAHGSAVETRIGEDLTTNLSTTSEKLAAQGQPCIANDSLDISSWGTDQPIADQLASRTAGLIGEFDRPDPEAIAKAVQLNLFLGFGAEARQLLSVFPIDDQNRAIWTSLAYLLDDESDNSPAFAGLEACDTAAALWAVLTKVSQPAGRQVNAPAALLAFSHLPLHLRQLLAPRLIDQFLQLRDENSAHAVKDAVMRAPGQDGVAMALVEAKIDMHERDARSAEEKLTPVLADPGSNAPDVLVAFVEARVAQDLPLKPELVPTLAGLVRETPEGANRARIVNALILAQAASGDFDAAFASLSENPATEIDLWRLLAKLGTDTDILNHGVLSERDSKPTVDHTTAEALTLRLLDLGFAGPASVWLANANARNSDPTLAAQVALKQDDPRAALRILAGTNTSKADGLRRAALAQLGDDTALAEIYAGDGNGGAQSAALARAGDWQGLVALNDGPWQSLAATLNLPPDLSADGPLAFARQLTEASAKTQTAVAALLETVPMPAKP